MALKINNKYVRLQLTDYNKLVTSYAVLCYNDEARSIEKTQHDMVDQFLATLELGLDKLARQSYHNKTAELNDKYRFFAFIYSAFFDFYFGHCTLDRHPGLIAGLRKYKAELKAIGFDQNWFRKPVQCKVYEYHSITFNSINDVSVEAAYIDYKKILDLSGIEYEDC